MWDDMVTAEYSARLDDCIELRNREKGIIDRLYERGQVDFLEHQLLVECVKDAYKMRIVELTRIEK